MQQVGRRTAVNQAPAGGSHYPFVRDNTYVPLLTDFYLAYEDDGQQFRLPFFVDWLYGFGSLPVSSSGGVTPTHSRDVVILDADGQTVFDSTQAIDYQETEWGTERVVCEWRDDRTVARLVARTSVTDEFDLVIEPGEELDVRTCDRLPGRVRSIRVGDDVFTGRVAFENGYNTTVLADEPVRTDGGRFRNPIRVEAVPGSGLGTADGCEETGEFIRTINRVAPDASGRFRIEANDCLRIHPPLSLLDDTATYNPASALLIDGDCTPCCGCDKFVQTYINLKNVWDEWHAAGAAAEAVRDLYAENRQRWLDQRACRAANPARLVAAGSKDCKSFVGGSFCNFSQCCIGPVELRLTFTKYAGGSAITWPGATLIEALIDGSGLNAVPWVPEVHGPVYRFLVDAANSQETTTVRMRLCVACEAGQSLGVALTVHVPDPPVDPETDVACELPTADVPSDVSAIWTANGVDAGSTVRAVLQKAVPLDPTSPTFNCNC